MRDVCRKDSPRAYVVHHSIHPQCFDVSEDAAPRLVADHAIPDSAGREDISDDDTHSAEETSDRTVARYHYQDVVSIPIPSPVVVNAANAALARRKPTQGKSSNKSSETATDQARQNLLLITQRLTLNWPRRCHSRRTHHEVALPVQFLILASYTTMKSAGKSLQSPCQSPCHDRGIYGPFKLLKGYYLV